MKVSQSACAEIPCPRCEAPEDAHCVTTGGKNCSPHAARWDAWRALYAQPRKYRLRHDVPQHRLHVGDTLACQPTPYDVSRLVVLRRLPDGYDPECTVSIHSVCRVRGKAGEVE